MKTKEYFNKNDNFIIGMWVTPTKDMRNDESMKMIKELGITTIYGFVSSERTKKDMIDMLKYCDKYGLDYLIASSYVSRLIKKYVTNNDNSLVDKCMSYLKDFNKYNSFKGVIFFDEPKKESMYALSVFTKKFQKEFKGKLAYTNLFPISALKATKYDTYEEYIQNFISLAEPEIVSYDEYPLMEDRILDDYLYNLDVVNYISEKNNLPMWDFIQTISIEHENQEKKRTPSRLDLRWLAFTSIAFGSKGLEYFTLYTPEQIDYGDAIFDPNGKKTVRYTYAKEINENIKNIKDYILDYKRVGTIFNKDELSSFNLYQKPLNSFNGIKVKEGNGYIVGCFENFNCNFSLLIMSLYPDKDLKIKLSIDESIKEFSVIDFYNKESITNLNNELEIEVSKGELKIINFRKYMKGEA